MFKLTCKVLTHIILSYLNHLSNTNLTPKTYLNYISKTKTYLNVLAGIQGPDPYQTTGKAQPAVVYDELSLLDPQDHDYGEYYILTITIYQNLYGL